MSKPADLHEWKLTTRMPDLKDWFLQVPAFSHPNLHPGSPTRTSSKTTTVSYLTSRSWQITTSACKRSSEARVFACHNIKTSLCHDTSDGPTWNPLQVLLKSWELGITVHRSSLPKLRLPIHAQLQVWRTPCYTRCISTIQKELSLAQRAQTHTCRWNPIQSHETPDFPCHETRWVLARCKIPWHGLVPWKPLTFHHWWVEHLGTFESGSGLSVLKRSSLLKRRWNKSSDHFRVQKRTELNYFHTSDISIRANK